jgi:hypothetical protein
MTLDLRTINITSGDAVVLYDFLSEAQEAGRGVHTEDPAIQLAFWHLLGAIEREVIASMTGGSAEYDRVHAATLAELREAALGD